jgi:RNA polymerase sigma factor (sigma-70 family)
MNGTADAVDGLRLYLAEIGREPLLTKTEEECLARTMEDGRRAAERLVARASLSPDERRAFDEAVVAAERARQRFLRANLRLVVSVARQWTRSGIPLLDLIQEGNLGLMRAVERFDYRRGFRFSTYATWWIRQAIRQAVANSGRLVRLPVHTGEAVRRVQREQRRLEDDRGGHASPDAVGLALGLQPDKVATLLRLALEPVSISEPLGEDGHELASVVADTSAMSPDDAALAPLVSVEIDRLLEALDGRDRRVMALRFGLDGGDPWSLEAIGLHLGISREAVRQCQVRALKTMRRLALASPETRELLAM